MIGHRPTKTVTIPRSKHGHISDRVQSVFKVKLQGSRAERLNELKNSESVLVFSGGYIQGVTDKKRYVYVGWNLETIGTHQMYAQYWNPHTKVLVLRHLLVVS